MSRDEVFDMVHGFDFNDIKEYIDDFVIDESCPLSFKEGAELHPIKDGEIGIFIRPHYNTYIIRHSFLNDWQIATDMVWRKWDKPESGFEAIDVEKLVFAIVKYFIEREGYYDMFYIGKNESHSFSPDLS